MAPSNNTHQKEDAPDTTYDFLQDDPEGMTYGRRIALYLMKRSKLYNPRLGQDPTEEPSLEKAWAYFEVRVLKFTMTATPG